MNKASALYLYSQKGIGLIELMISMLIGLFIMAGVLQMFSTSSQNQVAASGASRIQENIRYVFARIAEDISQSGNLGCFSSTAAANPDYNVNFENLLATNGNGDQYDFLSIVGGTNGVDANAGNAATANGTAPGTDELRIRYADNVSRFDVTQIAIDSVTVAGYPTGSGILRTGEVVVLSNCSEGATFVITNDPDSSGTGLLEHAASAATMGARNIIGTKNTAGASPLAAGGPMNVDITDDMFRNTKSPYYIYAGNTGAFEYSIGQRAGGGACSVNPTAASGPENCALFRSVGGNREELAQGVHNFQVEYGFTNAAGELTFAADPSPAERAMVDRIRVTINFNSVDNVVFTGNALDTANTGLLAPPPVSRTFNLFNQI